MQARPMQIWKGGMYLGRDHHGTPMEMSQPVTTRQMTINPYTPMAKRRDPGTDGYNSMDSADTVSVPHASFPTPYCPTKTAGPKELAHYGGRIPAWSPQPSEVHGGSRRVQQQQRQQPNVTATNYIPQLVELHNQRSRSQKVPSRGAVREGSKSGQRCRQNGSLARGEGDGPDPQRGRRREELQTAGGNSAFDTALSVPVRPRPLASCGQRECIPNVPAVSTSSATQAVHIAHSRDPSSSGKEHCSHKLPSHTPCPAPHPAHLELQATSKKHCFTDAHIHDFIAQRVARLKAERNQSRGCKDAERTHCLSSSNLNECLPSKQNAGLLHSKMDESGPQQFTSTASLEEVGLSSAGNAGSSALDYNGNEQLSTAFGKGIQEKHAELTCNVEKQDGLAKPTPENDSTGTQDTALNNSHTVYVSDCTEESPDFDLTKLLDTNVLSETGGKPISNKSCVDDMEYIGDADYCKTKLCQDTIAKELSTVPILRYSLVALKELVSSINSISYKINSPAEDIFDVIVRCYWNGNKDDVHVFTSTEYPQIMTLAAAVCAKNEDENPVILTAVSGITLEEFIEPQSASKVGNSGPREEYTSSWLNANGLDELDKEPGALHPISCVCHPEALGTVTQSLADSWQDEKMSTEMDTADSIQMSVLAVKEAPWFKSQRYEDISDDDIKNVRDMAVDLQSNRLPSETTIGNLSGTSSNDGPVYEDISDMEVSTDGSLIIDEPLITQMLNNVKQPTESRGPTNVPALAKHLFNSTQQSCDGTSNGDKTLWSTERELCPNGGKKNSRYNKGPGLISGSLPEMHADCSPQQVIYISSDEDLSTEEDGHTDTEMQENGTEVVSLQVSAQSTVVSECKIEEEDAEEDWLVIPVSIPHLQFVEVDRSHVSPAKTQSMNTNLPLQPSTTNKPLPTSRKSQLEVFDTLDSFLQAKTCPNSCSDPDSQIIIVSDDELLVPKPTEGNLIPAGPSNGNIVPLCRKRSSSCDTEDSSDYSSSQSSCNYLTVSPKCWENRNCCKSLKKKKRFNEKLHSATLSDGTEDSCVEEVEASLETAVTMTPEPKSSPIESDKDNENSVEFQKAPTKCHTKTNRTTILKGLKRLTVEGVKIKNGRAKVFSSSESEDSGDNFPVLQSGHLAENHRYPVKGPQQITSLDPEIYKTPPCVAEAEERISTPNRGLPEPNPIIPRLIFKMPSEQSEPLILKDKITTHKRKKDSSGLSRKTKKNIHSRNMMRDEKRRSNKRKMLDGPNGEQKINASNTGKHVTSSKPTSDSKDHLPTPKQLSTAALQKNTGHSTASSEPSRTASSSGTEPSRTASSSGTEPSRTASSSGTGPSRTASSSSTEPSRTSSSSGAQPSRTASSSGTEPSRTASSSGTAPSRTASNIKRTTPSPLETSPPKKRISHYCRNNKTNDSIHQKPSLLTRTASSEGKSTPSKVSKSSKPGRHSLDSKKAIVSDASGSTKGSARQQVRKDWKDSHVSTRKERRHSSGPEDTRGRASTSSQNASVLEPHDPGKGAELEPTPNVAKQKNNFCTATATLLMRRTKSQAKRLTQAAQHRGSPHQRRNSVGEGYKWSQTPKNMNNPRKPRPSSPSEVELLSQW